ncbi:MAG: NADH:flavin oxidoreductase [Thermodesulfobacteriota bacterium]
MAAAEMLFSSLELKGLKLKNRLFMAPFYVGYAGPDGKVNPLVLDHYREMAASGVALVVVENAAVDPTGLGSPFTLRADDDQFIPGLADLARVIKAEGAWAVLQLNHTGRYAFPPERIAPSPVDAGFGPPQEMNKADVDRMIKAYASASGRVKAAGFDGVEIHGGTGYLLVQFLSPRTNKRQDEYGGSLANRMRFPLEVIDAVRAEVGPDYPIGYRFLADELLPDGLKVAETGILAEHLARKDLAYLSVMVGTYDSFFLPEYLALERNEGYMVSFAAEIKKNVPGLPVAAAGRIQSPATAERILREGQADLIGLARVLLADPLWPRKAQGSAPGAIVACEPTCSLCSKRVWSLRPAFCSRWSRDRRQAFLARVGEKPEEADQT